MSLRVTIPAEFARKPRSVDEIARWKATEFRLFLLYVGPVALKKIIDPAVYKHFLLLSVSLFCLCSPVLCKSYCTYAGQLLKVFVQHAEQLYGREFLVYNVHSLLHLASDVEKFGHLDTISCFPFENSLQKVKKLVRSSRLPLHQIINRLGERIGVSRPCESSAAGSEQRFFCSRLHENGPVPNEYLGAQQYRLCKTSDFILKLSDADNCICIRDRLVGRVQNILKAGSECMVIYEEFLELECLFDYPLDSKQIGIYVASRLSGKLGVCPVASVKKCVCLPLDGKYAVIPLLHTV